VDETITKLQKEYNLVQTVVSDFDKYMEKVVSVWKGLEEKGTTPAEKQSYVKNKKKSFHVNFKGFCW